MSEIRRFKRDGADLVNAVSVDGRADRRRGAGYQMGEPLEHAINTALVLGRPLLVSGEPGCGKTDLGFAIARKLGVERVRFFAVKSDAEAQRLFYEYDALRRFHVAQLAGAGDGKGKDIAASDPRRFIRYQALGRAILDASKASRIADLLPIGEKPAPTPVRSVVIIDEIDKAPRDFPNDLLNEIDHLWFRVPELSGIVDQPETPREPIAAELRPIIVITSNLERQLPDAFLRRCVFHHIEHPEDPKLQRTILMGHLERDGANLADRDLSLAIELVAALRKQGMIKQPGLAELIEFSRALAMRADELDGQAFEARAKACSSALAKSTDDRPVVEAAIDTLSAR